MALNKKESAEETPDKCLMKNKTLEEFLVCTRYHSCRMFEEGLYLPNLKTFMLMFAKKMKEEDLKNILGIVNHFSLYLTVL